MTALAMDRSGQLSRCPFCRSHRLRVHEYSQRGHRYRVICLEPDCGGQGPARHDYDEAVEAWNARRPLIEAVELSKRYTKTGGV